MSSVGKQKLNLAAPMPSLIDGRYAPRRSINPAGTGLNPDVQAWSCRSSRAGDRGDLDDAASPGRDHVAAEFLGAEEIAGEVDRAERIPLGARQRRERAGAEHPGIVHQHL